uniref:F-box domain-containing protein n=1 Tax=Romanomermis culicivorax TaxID=13658 RepID=A0A915IFX3_ROMCU
MGIGSSSPIKLIDFEIPSDIIFEILLRVDDRTLFKCRLINKEFYSILNSSSFWMAKCSRSNVLFPKKLNDLAEDFSPNYRRIYCKEPYGRNLIRNPSGEDETKFWTLVKNGGDGFRIEKPPAGVDVEDKYSGGP